MEQGKESVRKIAECIVIGRYEGEVGNACLNDIQFGEIN